MYHARTLTGSCYDRFDASTIMGERYRQSSSNSRDVSGTAKIPKCTVIA